MNDTINSTQKVIDNLISINNYVDLYPTVYFACKALNYRTYPQKYDGDRPLSVYVDWQIKNGKLDPVLVFNNPLNVKGNSVAEKLKQSLRQLSVSTTREIDDCMVTKPSVIQK